MDLYANLIYLGLLNVITALLVKHILGHTYSQGVEAALVAFPRDTLQVYNCRTIPSS